jgi:pyruvate formate lyase activating enzyme
VRLKRPLSEGASCDSQVFEKALESGCKSISYTYNEPTIFLEYVLDCARLARKKGLKNVMVSNGYIKPEPLKDALKVIDAVNIDLKEFNEKFYEDIADAELKPVLDALKLMKGGCGLSSPTSSPRARMIT